MALAKARYPLSYLAAALCVLTAPGVVGASSPKAAEAYVPYRNGRLVRRWGGVKARDVVSVTALGGKSAKVQAVETSGDQLFIFRDPRRGVAHGVRVNTAQQLMAAELGEPRMVPGCAKIGLTFPLGPFPQGKKLMLMSHVGSRYVDGNTLPKSARKSMPKKQRLTAALIDFLSAQTDRKPANMMYHRKDHKIRLPDADGSFGAGLKKKKIFASVFFPGGRFAYDSPQKSFKALPPKHRVLVDKIVSSSVSDLRAYYGLTQKEAARLKKQAQAVHSKGLTAAIADFLGNHKLHSRR